MRFSVWPRLMQPWSDVVEVARHAEATGWDGVWVADHFMGDGGGFGPETSPTLEATGVIAALATATERVRLGPLVLGATYRHPAVVANWAATVDRVSGGRVVLGVGAGWQRNEHDQYGIDLPPAGERVDRFTEYLEVLTRLLPRDGAPPDGAAAGRSTFDGRWFTLRDAVCEPAPLQRPLPILVGGKGDRMVRRAARFADEWNMWGLPPVIAERSAFLDRCCADIGRDPATVRRSTQALLLPQPDGAVDDEAARRFLEAVAPRAAVAGTAAQITDVVGGWAVAGVDEVVVPDAPLGSGARRLELLDLLIEQVAPTFR
jgi:alkanesulfonate monooxygenase SsuD/methylene tetrahydromethanopterin reductase-like flavin-dependent oxidoreductase (luciferase family)